MTNITKSAAILEGIFDAEGEYAEAEHGIFIEGKLAGSKQSLSYPVSEDGSFTHSITILDPGDVYTWYAYAVIGGAIKKGEEKHFKTYTDVGWTLEPVDLDLQSREITTCRHERLRALHGCPCPRRAG